MNKLDLEDTTRRFHNVYEQVAKEYGYKTREDTKELDFNSPNGMTMLKTVEMITTPYLEEIERLKEREIMLQERFSDWKKGIEKERKYWLCERTDCCGRIKDSKKYSSLYQENKRLNNKLKDIKSQLDYLETYSSKEDVYEDMKGRLDRIDKIIGSE